MTNLLNTPNNRIIAAINAIASTIDGLDAEALARVEDSATLTDSEKLALGDKASLALATGVVTADEAQTLYAIWSDFDNATLAQRVTYMRAIMETMGR